MEIPLVKSILTFAGSLVAAGFVWAADAPERPFVLHEAVDGLAPSNANNLVTYAAPRAISLGALGLKAAGLKAGPALLRADEVRIFASREVMNESPKARLFLNSGKDGQWWYHTGGRGSAEGHVIRPGEAVVVITRVSARPIAWRNPLAE